MPENVSASKRETIIAFFLGIVFMIVALLVQSVFQSIPFFVYISFHGFNITTAFEESYAVLERNNFILFSIYIGSVAGILQEVTKYVAVDMRARKLSVPIGLGFAAVDIAYLAFVEFYSKSAFVGLAVILVCLNIIFSLIFHVGTATFLKSGLLSGSGRVSLAICILLHSAVDGGLVAADYLIYFHPSDRLTLISAYWILAMVAGVVIFLLGMRKIQNAPDSEPPVDRMVF